MTDEQLTTAILREMARAGKDHLAGAHAYQRIDPDMTEDAFRERFREVCVAIDEDRFGLVGEVIPPAPKPPAAPTDQGADTPRSPDLTDTSP